MTETMTDYTRPYGSEAVSPAAAEQSSEQKFASLQARLDVITAALLLSQVSQNYPQPIAKMLPFVPFFDGRRSAMGSANNMLPLALAMTLADDGSHPRDIAKTMLPLVAFFDGGGSGMGSANNMLPLVLAMTLADDGSHPSDRRENAERVSQEQGPKATGPAKRLAEELDIDLSQVEGTGAGGNITVNDIRAFAERAGDRADSRAVPVE